MDAVPLDGKGNLQADKNKSKTPLSPSSPPPSQNIFSDVEFDEKTFCWMELNDAPAGRVTTHGWIFVTFPFRSTG